MLVNTLTYCISDSVLSFNTLIIHQRCGAPPSLVVDKRMCPFFMSRILCINDDIFSGRRHAEPAAVLRTVPVQDTPGEEQLPPGQRLLAAQISVRV